MTIKQNGGVFGRNPTFNDVTIEGDLILNGETFTGLDFNGSWNASTNSPSLSSGTGTQGEFYIVSVAGTTNLDGVTNWGVGDYCFFNGTAWQRIEGGADGNFVNASVSGTLSFGAGEDLTISSNGTHGLIKAGNASADIRIESDQRLVVCDRGFNESFAIFNDDDDVKLFHDGNQRFATTSGGIQVTGDINYDGDLISSTAGTSNFVAGANAGNSITSGGNSNTVVGDEAGTAITTGNNNVALGFNALLAETQGDRSVAIGTNALAAQNNSSDADADNIAIGFQSGVSITTGTRNVAIGSQALDAADADGRNVAIGYASLSAMNTGNSTPYNVAIGYNAGTSVTTGVKNVLVGGLAGDAITDADGNVAMGHSAMSSNTVGSYSVALGFRALNNQNPSSATDMYNTAVGTDAGLAITTGVQNTLIGNLAGDTLTTGSGNVALGYNVDFGAVGRANAIGIGNNFSVSGDDRIQIGVGSNIATLLLDGSSTTWSASSDERLKENIVSSTAGLSFINDLRPVTYNWKKAKDVPSDLPQYIEGSDAPCLGHTYGTLKHGFIAQEVKRVIDNHPEVKDGQDIWQTDDANVQTLAPSALVPMLVKAIQEQQTLIESLTARITALEGE